VASNDELSEAKNLNSTLETKIRDLESALYKMHGQLADERKALKESQD